MIRIAIVEDEDSYVQVLTGYLKQYETEHSLSFQISVFHDGLDIVSEYKADYDVILLDIQMKHLDGMKTAEKIRELDEDVSFIFITSTIQFAVQGYLVDALGYVVKPVAYLAFSQILGKAVKKVKQKQQKDYMTKWKADRCAWISVRFITSKANATTFCSIPKKGIFSLPVQ